MLDLRDRRLAEELHAQYAKSEVMRRMTPGDLLAYVAQRDHEPVIEAALLSFACDLLFVRGVTEC